MSSRKFTTNEKKMSNECLSTSSLEIVIDDQFDCDSTDEDFNNQIRYSKTSSTDDRHSTYRQRKQTTLKNPKPHRLIEKKRRDRMNLSLGVLLELLPHKGPDSQRRIEKTEIIEMAIKYIRSLASSTQKSSDSLNIDKQMSLKIDAYRSGYHNSACDTYENLEKHSNNDRLLTDFIRFINENEIKLKDLTVVPDKKAKVLVSEKIPHVNCDISHPDDNISVISDVRKIADHNNILQFSNDEQHNPTEQTKVPIFVLHPSGTHYIPMCIDSSIVSHAFDHKSNISRSSSINEQLRCHPVSIPVNFNSMSSISDPYELEIQNINVIGTRHQTSVRPN